MMIYYRYLTPDRDRQKGNSILDRPVHIALASDRKYLPLAAVAVASAAENTSGELVVHFLYENLAEDDFRVFDFLKRYPRVTFRQHRIADAFFRDWPEMRWSRSIYHRLLLPDLLPELERVIYLDCDVCVLGDLAELYEQDPEGKSIMAVAVQTKPDHARRLGLDPDYYFNSGVLVFSPREWHRDGLIGRFKQCFTEISDKLKYPDQDILNVVFKDDVRFLHPRWNIITSTFRNEPVGCYRVETIVEAFRTPGIAHFTGGHKPWMTWKSFHHPFSLAMRRYARIAGQTKLVRLLNFKSLLFPAIAAQKKALPWDRSVIDRKFLR